MLNYYVNINQNKNIRYKNTNSKSNVIHSQIKQTIQKYYVVVLDGDKTINNEVQPCKYNKSMNTVYRSTLLIVFCIIKTD